MRLFCPWDSPGKNTGVGSPSLLQGIFPTQGSNTGLPYCRRVLYHLSHQGNPRKLEWVACPSSRGSSWPRHWIRVSCTADRFSTSWASREAQREPETLSEMSFHEDYGSCPGAARCDPTETEPKSNIQQNSTLLNYWRESKWRQPLWRTVSAAKSLSRVRLCATP